LVELWAVHWGSNAGRMVCLSQTHGRQAKESREAPGRQFDDAIPHSAISAPVVEVVQQHIVR
jgi:hypothetical protein